MTYALDVPAWQIVDEAPALPPYLGLVPHLASAGRRSIAHLRFPTSQWVPIVMIRLQNPSKRRN